MNSSNTSHSTDKWMLQLCDGDEKSGNAQITASIIALNFLSLVCCILFLMVIKQLELHKKSRYYDMLIQIAVVDIYGSVAIAIGAVPKAELFLNHNKVWSMIYTALLDTSAGLIYLILAYASCERYIAMCRPFCYEDNPLINHFKRAIVVMWAHQPILHFCKYAACLEDLCLSSNGRVYCGAEFGEKAINLCLIAIPVSVIAVTQTLVIIEIKRMRSRLLTADEQTLKEQTKCMLAMILISFGFLIITVCLRLLSTVFAVSHASDADHVSSMVYWSFHSLSGATNKVVYGCIYPAYRHKMIHLMRSCFCPNG